MCILEPHATLTRMTCVVYVGAALPPLTKSDMRCVCILPQCTATPEKSDINIVHALHLFVMQRIRFKDWKLDFKKDCS